RPRRAGLGFHAGSPLGSPRLVRRSSQGEGTSLLERPNTAARRSARHHAVARKQPPTRRRGTEEQRRRRASIMSSNWSFRSLQEDALAIRRKFLEMHFTARAGHIGTGLSDIDIL